MKNILLFNFVLLSILFASVNIQAKPSIKEAGTAINKLVPEISAIDIDGNEQTIQKLSGAKGLVLVFFRSADWCPYCKKHLIEINEWNDKIKDLGFNVAAVSYDSIDILKSFTESHQLKYALLADQNHKTMLDFNVINNEEEPGDKHYGIPFPGVIVIDNSGKLIYKYFYKGYKKRVKLPVLFEQLNNIER